MGRGIRLAMPASGGGTTVEAILKARNAGQLQGIEPVLLITDRPGAGVVERAKNQGLTNHRLIERKRFGRDIEAFGEELLRVLQEFDVELVGQYGWLSLTPANVIDAFDHGRRIINQHPGPVPWFGGTGVWGRRPHAAVLKFRELCARKRGFRLSDTCVVSQFVAPRYDRGAVVHYKSVPIKEGDTPATLQQRALPFEWETQIETLRLLSNGPARESSSYYADPFVLPEEEELAEEAVAYALTTQP